jgi:cytochrome c oxidase subunit 2
MNELFRRLLALPPQASTVARDLDTLHYVVIGTSVLGALGVACATAWFLWRYRASRRPGATPAQPKPIPLGLELAAIAGLLGLFLGFWVVGFRQYVTLRTPPAGAMDVYVVAKQWMWAFAYPDGSASNGDLYVPVGQPVRLLMTSRDVIHSFWVPAFRIKQDVVPGRMSFTWFEARTPGVYDVMCAEYCGPYHSAMRGRVVALAPADYEAWKEGLRQEALAVNGTPITPLAREGERLAAERGCLRCHTVDGTPHLGPTWAGLYGHDIELSDGRVQRVDDAYLTESMMEPLTKLHRGFAPIMPSYLGLLGAGETAAIVEYIHSLAGRTPAAPGEQAPLAPAGSPAPVLPTAPATPGAVP